jgi:protein KTI12
MALVVMCGQPCSGKSEAAACLTAALRSSSADLTVRIIDESSLHLGRNDSYKGTAVTYCNCALFSLVHAHFHLTHVISLFVLFIDMIVEKNLRGVLRSEVDRSLSRDSIIIVDSLNNIKVRKVSCPWQSCNGFLITNSSVHDLFLCYSLRS